MISRLLCLAGLLIFGCSTAAPKPITTVSKAPISVAQNTEDVKLYSDVKWLEWGDVALLRAKLKKKPLAIYFYDDSCSFCHLMEQTTFKDPLVVSLLNSEFIAVKARGEDHPKEIDVLFGGAHVYPAIAFLASDGTLLVAVNGFVPPENYAKALQTIIKANSDVIICSTNGTCE